MNDFAVKTRNQNLLRTKTKTFKSNNNQSEKRIKASSSLSNLAGKLYSSQYNEGFSAKKSRIVKSQSRDTKTVRKQSNPQFPMISPQSIIKSTISMSGLNLRASHIPGFADVNTSLLLQKKSLQQRIQILKQQIIHNKKLYNQADYNGKKNSNDNQKMNDFYRQACNKSQDLCTKINLVNSEISALRRQNAETTCRLNQKKQNINKQRSLCQQLDRDVKNLKIMAMQEEKQRNHVKGDLGKAQRVMESASIYCKQLENQRATLLLSINQSVVHNKI